MSYKKSASLSLSFAFFVSCLIPLNCLVSSARAQTGDPAPAQKKFTPSADLSLGGFGQLTATRTPATTNVYGLTGTGFTQTTQGAAASAGLLATFHQSLRPWLGYNANFGFTRLTEQYSNGMQFVPNSTSGLSPSSSFIRGAVRTNMYEATVAAVLDGPRSRRFSTFTQVGGGGLFFDPLSSIQGARQQVRPALLFGAGANFKLTPRLDLRAEYRGLLYKSPDFTLPDIYPGLSPTSQFPMTRLFTVTSEPTISLVYHLGHAQPAPASQHKF